jgi:class 3 adenylate cyclase
MSIAAELREFELPLPRTDSYMPSLVDEVFLLKEMNHRFANTLTLLISQFRGDSASLASSQSREIVARHEARIVAFGDLHRSLLVDAANTTISVQDYVERLCTRATDSERVLATVLFTDIVDSTRSSAEMGDWRWRNVLDDHDRLARQIVSQHRGNIIKMTGDGLLATFDGPSRAVRCALMFGSAASQIGLPIRAGLHTGEIEIRGNDIGGIAVNAAARIMAKCNANEVLVSRVTTDLICGAGLGFNKRGSYRLKGLSGRWDIFVAANDKSADH